MKNELQRHKKSDKIKWIFTGIAFVLAFVLLAGLCLQVFGTDKMKPSNWGKQDEEPVEEYPIELSVTPIARELFGEYGIMPTAESAQTVSVMKANAYFTYKWSIAWVSEKSEDVSDFVQLSAKEGSSVNVSALKPFDTQVILTCSLHVSANAEASSSATCTVDFAQRFDSVFINGVKVTDGQTIELSDLIDVEKNYIDVVNNFNFKFTGSLGVGSLTGSAIPTIEGGVKMYDTTGLVDSSLCLESCRFEGTSIYESYILACFNSAYGVNGQGITELLKNGDYTVAHACFEALSAHQQDIKIEVDWICGSESGKVTFYINVSDSLFDDITPSAPQLSQSGIVL